MRDQSSNDYPLKDSQATVMLDRAIKAAQARGRSQRDIATNDLGYASSVVLSHMAAGRVPIPIDRAKDIANALGMDPTVFLLKVLEQRFPEVDFKSLFNVSYSSDRTIARLEAVAGNSLDGLSSDLLGMLEEVVAARNPRRRWLAPAELATIDLIRSLRPDSPYSGLSDDDRGAIVKALKR